MRVSDFDFELPPERIALRPASPRESAKLLVVRPDRLEDRSVADLPGLLRPGDVLVFNDTKVIPAALSRPAHRPRRNHAEDRGAAAHAARRQPLEGLCQARQEAAGGRPAASLARRRAARHLERRWRTRARRARSRSPLTCPDRSSMRPLHAVGRDALAALHRGQARRSTRRTAPTTRRFTPRRKAPWQRPPPGCTSRRTLMKSLQEAGISTEFVTLHVGAGTFLPVKAEDTRRPQDACRVGRGVGGTLPGG